MNHLNGLIDMPDFLIVNAFEKTLVKLNFKTFISLLMAITLLATLDVEAAEKKDKSARRLQQMGQQLQQAEQEKADLQSQIDVAKKATAEAEDKAKKSDELAASLSKKLGVSERKVASAIAEVKTLTTEKITLGDKLQKTEAELESNKKNLAELTEKYQTAQNDLKVGENQRKEQLLTIQQKSSRIDLCEQKNLKLYGFGLELIKTFEKPSEYEVALRTEKFTQLKRVQLENTMQEYRDKLEDSRILSTNH
jgi:chromosome segregation ATPase